MNYLGDFLENEIIHFMLTTNDRSGGAVAPSSAFEAADLKIYKDNGATQKVTSNGITMTSPFDVITGLHAVDIDTSNDTGDVGFWLIGSDYIVVLDPDETVDGQTVVSVIAHFSIENRNSIAITDFIIKNQPFDNFEFPMYRDVTLDIGVNLPATGLTVTGEKTIDSAAFVPVAGIITEISKGMYSIDLTAADTNGKTVTYAFSGTGAQTTLRTVFPS